MHKLNYYGVLMYFKKYVFLYLNKSLNYNYLSNIYKYYYYLNVTTYNRREYSKYNIMVDKHIFINYYIITLLY